MESENHLKQKHNDLWDMYLKSTQFEDRMVMNEAKTVTLIGYQRSLLREFERIQLALAELDKNKELDQVD